MPRILYDQPLLGNEYNGDEVLSVTPATIVRVIGKPSRCDDELGAILLRVEPDMYTSQTVSFVDIKDGSTWGMDLEGYKFVELKISQIILD